MEQTDLEVLSRFEEVWQRVQNGHTEQIKTSTNEVEALMEGLYYSWHGCRQLAQCTCGFEKSRLLVVSKAIKEQFLKIQRYYFLKTGDVYFADATANFASYTPYNLRKLWQITVKNGEMLKKCNLNDDAVFVADFLAMERSFQFQKTELEALIGRLLQ